MLKSDRPRTPSDQVARPRDPGELAGGFISQRLGPSKLSCSVALSTDELDRDPGLPERRVAKTKQKALGIVGGKPRRYKHPSMYFLTYTNRFLTQNPGGGVGKALAFFRGSAGVPRCAPRPTELASYYFDNSKWWITRLGGR